MPKKTFRLPLERKYIQFGAMAYLAILAYPTEKDKRDRFIEAYKALVIKAAVRRGYSRKQYRERFRRMTNQTINGVLRQGDARIYKRLRAAEITKLRIFSKLGVPLFERAVSSLAGRPMKAQIRMNDTDLGRQPSFNKIAGWFAREINRSRGIAYGGTRREHIITRTYRESRPVVHLALALLPRWRECKTRNRSELWDLFLRPDWLADTLKQSEFLRHVLCKSAELKFLGISARETIRVLPETVEKMAPRKSGRRLIKDKKRRSSTG